MRNEELIKAIEEFSKKRVVVLGDVMLDEFIFGKVSRISPEAPVPVVDVKERIYQLGGAANVIHNIHTLGAEVFSVGAIGNDPEGERLKSIFAEKNINYQGLVVDKKRPTTLKTRIIAHSQHIVRVDSEERAAISEDISDELFDKLKYFLEFSDCLIVSDYAKGVINPYLISKIKNLLKELNYKLTLVDPKVKNLMLFKEFDIMVINQKEVESLYNQGSLEQDQIIEKGKELKKQLNLKTLIITQGESGMTFFENDDAVYIKTKAKEVYDVTGAGDSVVATLALAKLAGLSSKYAVELANIAAGIVVQKLATAPVYKQELIKTLKDDAL